MIWGLDSSRPPTPEVAAARYDQGYRFYGGYIGGRTPYAWSSVEWSWVLGAGLAALPIWVASLTDSAEVGAREGERALQSLHDAGLSNLIVLDIENGLIPQRYLPAFVQVVNDAAAQVCLYGNLSTVRALGTPDLVDWIWLAFWIRSPVVMGPVPPRIDIWQCGDGAIADLNIAHETMSFATPI